MKVSWPAPSVTAPRASSGCQGTPIFRTSTISSGASSARAISKPTATPPRGNARTTGCRSFRCKSLSASRRPASPRSANFMSTFPEFRRCNSRFAAPRRLAIPAFAKPGRARCSNTAGRRSLHLLAAEKQGIGAQQKLGDDQQHDIPFDAQAAPGLHQAEQSFYGARDDVELAVESTVAVAELVFLREPHIKAFEFGMIPQQL